MLFNRDTTPQYGFIVLDRNRPDYLVELFADVSKVSHEETSEKDMSNTVRYENAGGDVVYLLAFETAAVAQGIFQKLKQAVLLVSMTRRGNDRRSLQAQRLPASPAVNGTNSPLNGSGHASRNGPSKTALFDEQVTPNGNTEIRSGNLVTQLLAAKANFNAAHVNTHNAVQSPKIQHSHIHANGLGNSHNNAQISTKKATENGANRNHSAGAYYAKPSAPTVSINVIPSVNCTVKAEGAAKRTDGQEAEQNPEAGGSPSRTVPVTRTQPISLNQLFGNANSAGPFKTVSEHPVSSPSAIKGLLNGLNGTATDSLSNEAFTKSSFSFGLPATPLTNLPHSVLENGIEVVSNTNGSWPEEGERSGRLADTDGGDSDSLLIAPDAFVTREKLSHGDANRVLLDMVMNSRTERPTVEQATDMRVEDRSRTATTSDTSGEPSSTTANDDLVSRSRHSSACSNSVPSKSNSNSSDSARDIERKATRRVRDNHALQLTKEQFRATLVDMLEVCLAYLFIY